MELPVAKPDVRERVARLCAASVVLLTFVVSHDEWSLETARGWGVLAAVGFLLAAVGLVFARLTARFGPKIPVPRSLHRVGCRLSFRRMAGDQPFNTRLGWTGDAEPGGALPDARKVTPFGQYGGGLYTDGFVGGLVLAALFAVVFAAHPVTALIIPLYVLAYGVIGFAVVSLVRFLRNH